MADYNFVNARLATGAALTSPEDAVQIVASGITHVVDCTDQEDDTQLFLQTGVQVLWNPVPDDGQPKAPDWFGRSLEFALPALAQPKMKVYAHCSAGMNRGPSTCFAIMLALGFAPDDAEAVIRKARPQVMLAYKEDAINAIPVLGYD